MEDDPHAPAKILSITSFEELEGYEQEAKRRGITGQEIRHLAQKREQLRRNAAKERRRGRGKHQVS